MNIIHPEKEENVIICDNMDWHWGFYLSEIRQRNINTVWSHLPMEFLKNVINTKNKLVVARGKGWTCQNVQTSCYKKNKSWACHTQYLLRCVCVLVSQSCRTLWNPVDCSLPGSSVHGILQARTLEWFSCPSPKELPNPGIELGSPAWQADSLPSEPPGSPVDLKSSYHEKKYL